MSTSTMTLFWKPSLCSTLQAAQYGFTVQHLADQPPGLDQKATWLRGQRDASPTGSSCAPKAS